MSLQSQPSFLRYPPFNMTYRDALRYVNEHRFFLWLIDSLSVYPHQFNLMTDDMKLYYLLRYIQTCIFTYKSST